MKLTQERLKELLSYDPLTGVFLWRGGQKKTVAGSVAGTIDKDGYVIICADQKLYRAHRLAWLWVHEEWPPSQIDHKDRNRSNNQISNLRPATKSQNMRNRPCQGTSTTGVKGVQYDERRGVYYATITTEGRRTWLGYHATAEEASAAYHAASIEQHKEFARAA